jgi:biotin transporter BioY
MRLGLSVVGAQAIILLCGSLVLSTFVGAENAIVMGIAPFLAGDVIKSVLLFTMIRSVRWNEAK